MTPTDIIQLIHQYTTHEPLGIPLALTPIATATITLLTTRR